MTMFGVAVPTSAVVLVSLMPIVSAGSAAASFNTLTGNVCTAPEAVPAGNVSVPLAGV